MQLEHITILFFKKKPCPVKAKVTPFTLIASGFQRHSNEVFPYLQVRGLRERLNDFHLSLFQNHMRLTKGAGEKMFLHINYIGNYFSLVLWLFYRPHDKKMYLVVGSTKTLLLNVSLHNAGDDAYETVLHIQFPKGLYFIRVPDLVRSRKSAKQ